jgi:hypothetical protein
MIVGVGWCVLRTSRSAYAETVGEPAIGDMNKAIREADEALWVEFREWMTTNSSPTLQWVLHEQHNNHDGVLQVFLSRNHRSSPFWDMLTWIAEHGKGSYGLFYVHDDEDTNRGDFSNVFRVHRLMNGSVDELADPFFGPIIPNVEPMHPYDRDIPDEG